MPQYRYRALVKGVHYRGRDMAIGDVFEAHDHATRTQVELGQVEMIPDPPPRPRRKVIEVIPDAAPVEAPPASDEF